MLNLSTKEQCIVKELYATTIKEIDYVGRCMLTNINTNMGLSLPCRKKGRYGWVSI